MEHEPDEYELALRARGGDPDALAELVERTRLRLFSLAYAELRHYEDAQDAVASALLQICRHITELREPARVCEWMQSIARNEARRLRRGRRPPAMSLEEADGAAAEESLSLLRLDIERALRELPGDQARVNRLYYLADLSIAEIARRTGRPAGTIKSWLHRGRQRLALEMEEYAPMKRRDVIKVLAAAPVLATTMEESAAMTPTPAPTPAPERAAIVHTDLQSAQLQQIEAAVRSGPYQPEVLTPTDPIPLMEELKEYQVIILDEWIGGRSALEYLVHLRARPDTQLVPVCLLCSDPSEFTISAYFAAGTSQLVNKDDPADLSKLAGPFERPGASLWGRFTERARRMVYDAEEEAARLGEYQVGPEHLLLGLIRDPESIGSIILVSMGIPLAAVREEILRDMTQGPGTQGRDLELTARGKRVVDLAYVEARLLRNNYIGTEHLLLGLIGVGDGLAARVLVTLGASLERARREVWTMQEKAGA